MTEEQLNQLKTAIKIRLEHSEEVLKRYEDKGVMFDSLKLKIEGEANAYEIVLKDIEKIMSK